MLMRIVPGALPPLLLLLPATFPELGAGARTSADPHTYTLFYGKSVPRFHYQTLVGTRDGGIYQVTRANSDNDPAGCGEFPTLRRFDVDVEAAAATDGSGTAVQRSAAAPEAIVPDGISVTWTACSPVRFARLAFDADGLDLFAVGVHYEEAGDAYASRGSLLAFRLSQATGETVGDPIVIASKEELGRDLPALHAIAIVDGDDDDHDDGVSAFRPIGILNFAGKFVTVPAGNPLLNLTSQDQASSGFFVRNCDYSRTGNLFHCLVDRLCTLGVQGDGCLDFIIAEVDGRGVVREASIPLPSPRYINRVIRTKDGAIFVGAGGSSAEGRPVGKRIRPGALTVLRVDPDSLEVVWSSTVTSSVPLGLFYGMDARLEAEMNELVISTGVFLDEAQEPPETFTVGDVSLPGRGVGTSDVVVVSLNATDGTQVGAAIVRTPGPDENRMVHILGDGTWVVSGELNIEEGDCCSDAMSLAAFSFAGAQGAGSGGSVDPPPQQAMSPTSQPEQPAASPAAVGAPIAPFSAPLQTASPTVVLPPAGPTAVADLDSVADGEAEDEALVTVPGFTSAPATSGLEVSTEEPTRTDVPSSSAHVAMMRRPHRSATIFSILVLKYFTRLATWS